MRGPIFYFNDYLIYRMASTAVISFFYGAILVAGGLFGYAKVCIE